MDANFWQGFWQVFLSGLVGFGLAFVALKVAITKLKADFENLKEQFHLENGELKQKLDALSKQNQDILIALERLKTESETKRNLRKNLNQ